MTFPFYSWLNSSNFVSFIVMFLCFYLFSLFSSLIISNSIYFSEIYFDINIVTSGFLGLVITRYVVINLFTFILFLSLCLILVVCTKLCLPFHTIGHSLFFHWNIFVKSSVYLIWLKYSKYNKVYFWSQ